jgi:hypothetical protein
VLEADSGAVANLTPVTPQSRVSTIVAATTVAVLVVLLAIGFAVCIWRANKREPTQQQYSKTRIDFRSADLSRLPSESRSYALSNGCSTDRQSVPAAFRIRGSIRCVCPFV